MLMATHLLRQGSLVGVLGLCLATPAWAFFQETVPVPPAHPSPVTSSSPVTSGLSRTQGFGTAPAVGPGIHFVGTGYARAMTSQAHNIPLQDALLLLLPSGWRYEAHGAAARVNPPVSWSGRAPWTRRLREIGRAEDLRFTVDWPHRVVTAALAVPAPSSVVIVKPAALVATKAPAPSAPHGTVIPSRTWVVPAGIPLRTTLRKWGGLAHWTIRWQGPNWIPNHTLRLTGTFTHAMQGLAQDLEAHISGGRIRMDVYPGHVWVIHAIHTPHHQENS